MAVLDVDGDRQVGRRVHRGDVRDDLVERHVAVDSPEREREAGARGRERLEASAASMRAEPASHGFGITNGSLVQARNAAAFRSCLVTRPRSPPPPR